MYRFSLIVLIPLLVIFTSFGQINSRPLNDDSSDNLKLAIGLAHHGIVGMSHVVEGKEVFQPSNFREPFPVWVTAQWIVLNDALYSDKELGNVQSNEKLMLLKVPNLLFYALTIYGVYFLTSYLCKKNSSKKLSDWLPIFAVILTVVCFRTVTISTLLTEVHAACIIIWFSFISILFIDKNSHWLGILAGTLFGLLILTKAAFLYISIIFFLFGISVGLVTNNKLFLSKVFYLFIISMTVTFSWMLRNYVTLGQVEIAQRGSNVLLTRAFKSQMNDAEFHGAFYAYAPLTLKEPLGLLLGLSEKDREYGGKLQRFTRIYEADLMCREKRDEDCAVSYYIKSTIRHLNIVESFKRKYPADQLKAEYLGNEAAKNQAIGLIKNNIWGHIRTSIVFAWRGAWPNNKVDGRWGSTSQLTLKQIVVDLVPFFGLCTTFLLSFYAFKDKNEAFILTMPSAIAFNFYAITSHFIPRYSEMFIPIWIVSLIYAVFLRESRKKEATHSLSRSKNFSAQL